MEKINMEKINMEKINPLVLIYIIAIGILLVIANVVTFFQPSSFEDNPVIASTTPTLGSFIK